MKNDRRGSVAVGMVHRPSGTPAADRDWARALVVRHAHARRLRLLDVLEIDDDADRTRDVMRRLADLVSGTNAGTLITEGIVEDLADAITRDLDLTHEPVAPRSRPHQLG